MDPQQVLDSFKSLLNDGNYSVLVLIVGALFLGRWRLNEFDAKNTREHQLTSDKIDDTAAGLGRSIDRVENVVIATQDHIIRTEEKLDTHLNDHIVSLSPSRQQKS